MRSNTRISGPRLHGRPLLDRIDIYMEVPRVAYDKLSNAVRGESSENIRARIEGARTRQGQSFAGTRLVCKSDMEPAQIREFCTLREEASALMRAAMRQMHLSTRAYHRILKVSGTIADLGSVVDIQTHHLAEALQYRTRVLDM